LENQVFGRLRVLELHSKDKNYNKRWLCICECGKEHVVLQDKLRDGTVKSCGCLRDEHNQMQKSRAELERRPYTRKSYAAMVNRCTNPNAPAWAKYGGRGVTVCDRWLYGENGLSGWECFFRDMGPRPKNTSIDRIDPLKGYYFKNCRWATQSQQQDNRLPHGYWSRRES